MSTDPRIEKKFQKLLEEGQAILNQAGWDGSQYQRHPDDVDYRRFRTEALNLIRRVCGSDSDHYEELKRLAEVTETSLNSHYYKDCYGVLQAAHQDYQDALLFDLRSLIAAEVLGDFVDQATELHTQGYHAAAASLVGG